MEELKPCESIVIRWGEEQNESRVHIKLSKIKTNAILVQICYDDFKQKGVDLVRQVVDSTTGFNLMLAGMKAWLEHGIRLRLVEDQYPKPEQG